MDLDLATSPDYLPMDPKRLLERLHTALNARDLVNLMHLFQVDFEQFWPGQGKKETTGLEPVRTEWEHIFRDHPDFRADLIAKAFEGMMIWSEWRWLGNGGAAGGGESIKRVGVIIFSVEEGLIASARYYMVEDRS